MSSEFTWPQATAWHSVQPWKKCVAPQGFAPSMKLTELELITWRSSMPGLEEVRFCHSLARKPSMASQCLQNEATWPHSQHSLKQSPAFTPPVTCYPLASCTAVRAGILPRFPAHSVRCRTARPSPEPEPSLPAQSHLCESYTSPGDRLKCHSSHPSPNLPAVQSPLLPALGLVLPLS